MTQIEKFEPVATMSSREIAELCDKEHKNVLADIRNMLNGLGQAAAEFSATAKINGPNGSMREIEVFNLPKRETLILVSGYSVKLRARIIDRWQELEAAAHDPFGGFKIPRTLNEALRLSLELSDKVEEQAAQIEAMKPKLNFMIGSQRQLMRSVLDTQQGA